MLKISLPGSEARDFIDGIQDLPGVLGIEHLQATSVSPKGDVIELTLSDRALMQVMHVLDQAGIGQREGTSVTVSRLNAVISPSAWKNLGFDPAEAPLEEAETISGTESNMTRDTLTLMAISGFIAAWGISTNTLHIVIGAMVISPGFVPLARMGLGLAAGMDSFWRGLRDTAIGYSSLAAGALLAALIIHFMGSDPLQHSTQYMEPRTLVRFWSTFTASSALVSMAASVGGGILISSNRTSLTGGVMIALGMIPSLTLAILALVAGSFGVAGQAALRWLLDAVIVVGVSFLVFGWKRYFVHKRRMMFG